jgi:anti-sigma factor RsiW
LKEEAMEPEPTEGLSEEQLADLARLADGTLPAERRAEVEARVAASPQLASILERQSVALEALRGTAEIGAPARLRADVERGRGGRADRGRRRGIVFGAPIAAAAAVALALVLVLSGGSSSNPSVADTTALAQKAPTQAAPAPVPGDPALLRARVDDVPFPNYSAKFGWKASGARHDAPSGRGATTVFYGKGSRTIAYTIVSGEALDPPQDARATKRDGVVFRTFRDGGRAVVTWERNGHTCVLSSRAARPEELVALADWRGKGAIPF